MKSGLIGIGWGLLLIGLGWGTSAAADPVADFYKGKSITLMIGASAGGGYDTLARAVARYLPRHIPGSPNVVPSNVPGAGGIVAIKNLATISQRDGTVIGLMRNEVPLDPLFGTEEADYDPTKLNWLGTLSVETGLLIVWHTSPFMTIEDAKQREMTAGADGVTSEPAFFSRVLNELLGTKIKVIAGYPGQNEAYLAIERGELDTFGVTYWSSLTSTKQDWLRENKIRILLQYGPIKEAALKDVPYGPDLVTSNEDKLLFRAAYGPLTLGRPFALPPEVPADRVAALRKAFMDMIADKDFRAEADKLGLQVDNPRSGEQLQKEMGRLYAIPKDVLERLRRLAQAN